MRLVVTEARLPAYSTVGKAVGRDEGGISWRFVVDHRPLVALIEVLEAGDEPDVWVEPWQILGPAGAVRLEPIALAQLRPGAGAARCPLAESEDNPRASE